MVKARLIPNRRTQTCFSSRSGALSARGLAVRVVIIRRASDAVQPALGRLPLKGDIITRSRACTEGPGLIGHAAAGENMGSNRFLQT